MATNREKLNKMTNEEFCETISKQILLCRETDESGKPIINTDSFYRWLSQEAEEDIVNIPNIGKMPKTDKIISDYEKPEIIQLTKGAYKDILARLDKIEEKISPYSWNIKNILKRLGKLEEFYLCITKILESHNLNYTKEKTADEMFKELGYEKMNDYEYKRIKPDRKGREVYITIDDNEAIKYIKDKKLNAGIAEWVSKEELNAIYIKMEELKDATKM